MLVPCQGCQSIICNHCDECPWCHAPRTPILEPAKKRQISLLWFLLLIPLVGVWFGLLLRGPIR